MQIWKTTYGIFKFYDSGPLWYEETGPRLMSAYVKHNYFDDEYLGFFSSDPTPHPRPLPPPSGQKTTRNVRNSFHEVSSVELQLAARAFREDYRKETENYSEPWWAKIFKSKI